MNAPPAINQLVHYVAHGSADGTYPQACRSALITNVGAWVDDETRELDGTPEQRRVVMQHWDHMAVALTVFNPTGMFMHGAIRYDEGRQLGAAYDEYFEPGRSVLCTGLAHAGGTWHWPVLM